MPALPSRRAGPPGWPMIGQAVARHIDVLGLLGLLLFVALWQLLTYVIPRFSLPTPLDVAEYFQRYAETLRGVDDSIGRVLEYLGSERLLDSTVVQIFFGDDCFATAG